MKNTLLAALAFAFAVSLAAPAPAQDAAPTAPAAKPAQDAAPAAKPAQDAAPAANPAQDAAPAAKPAKPKPAKPGAAAAKKPKPAAAAEPPAAANAPAAAPATAAGPAAAPGAAAAPAAQEEPAPTGKIDRAEAIKRANAFFNASPVLNADFVQIGSDGKRSEGKLYTQRAGRVRFEYAQPATLELVADGARVMVRDLKLKTQDIYAIDQTPLKFLLKEKIDFEHDVKVLDVTTDDNGVVISLEDKVTFGGTSHLKLIFDPKTFKLRQWQITDPQGYETLLSLFNIDQKRTPDPALFKIDVNAKSE
ncbi:MAG TPA: outer-membrane lipoprotein carrier protein LolA [Methylocystis sp.]